MVITVVVNLGLKNVIATDNGHGALGMGHGKNRIRMASLTAASLIPNAHCPLPIAHCPIPYPRIRFSKDNLPL